MNYSSKLRFSLNLTVLLALTCIFTGCIAPHTSPRAPELRGRVLDAKTHLPVKGVKVYFCDPPHHTVYTDADGYFLMKSAKNFHWLAGADSSGYPPPKADGICLSHKGYVTRDFWRGYNGDPLNILLQPIP